MELILDEPRLALPVLDQMGVKNYQVIDDRQIHIYEHLEESGVINMELAKQGIVVRSISIQSEELESYFLNLTGGEKHA